MERNLKLLTILEHAQDEYERTLRESREKMRECLEVIELITKKRFSYE